MSTSKKGDMHYSTFISVLVVLVIVLGVISYFSTVQGPNEDFFPEPAKELPSDDVIEEFPEPPVPEDIEPIEEFPEPIEPEEDYEVHIVNMINLRFIPASIEIKEGDIVRWVNKDKIGTNVRVHVVKAHYGIFMSPRLLYNETFEYQFNEAGEYTYIDSIFPNLMRGKIIVKEIK